MKLQNENISIASHLINFTSFANRVFRKSIIIDWNNVFAFQVKLRTFSLISNWHHVLSKVAI